MTGKVLQIERAELRRLAEKRLKESAVKEPQSLVETQRLFHELEVHKIELEMQNAEICKARDDVEMLLDKYTELYDFAPVCYFTLDHLGLISNINLAGSGLLGVERSRLNGRCLTDFINDSDRPAFAAFVDKIFTSSSKEKYEVPLLKGDSQIFVQIEAVAAASGQECRIALIDITERKRAEVALLKVETAADMAFRKLEAVAGVARRKVEVVAGVARRKVEEATEVALIGEKDAAEVAFLKVEEAAELAFQTVKEAAEVAFQTVEDAAEVAHLKVEEAAEAALPGENEATEAVKKAADAARRMVENAAGLARQKVKETAEMMFHALRRAAEAEAQIKFTEERLRLDELLFHSQKLESLGVLAGGIAHDFNNILTGILGNVTLAQQFIDETHKSFKPLGFAEKAALRAAALATQLLTFAKGGAPVKKPVSLPPIIEESLSLALHGTGVICQVQLSELLRNVEADEGQLSQVFNNIIINAAQAMPNGGTLNVGAENVTLPAGNNQELPPGAYVSITFADEGCGMSNEIQRNVFDPYYTTKSSGTGLGLASVHSIVRKHGGHIDLRSAVGSGTVFTIYLPSIDVEIIPPGTCGLHSKSSRAVEGNVLILDDEAVIRDLATQILQLMGYQGIGCANGEDAVALYGAALKSGTPFLAVIVDLTIPGGIGGKEAAQRILAIDPAARLIVSSGYSNDPVIAAFGGYGFCAALTKPYSVSEFTQVMTEINPTYALPGILLPKSA